MPESSDSDEWKYLYSIYNINKQIMDKIKKAVGPKTIGDF